MCCLLFALLQMAEKRRYCKWKAADIARAVKEGRQPMQGGIGEEEAPEGAPAVSAPASAAADFGIPMAPTGMPLGMDKPPPALPTPAPAPAPAPYEIPSAPSSAPFVAPPSLPIPGYAPQVPPAQQYQQYQQPAQPVAQPQFQPAVTQSKPSFNSTAPPKSMNDPRAKDCVELCQFAISALKHNDINLARERLQAALNHLG